MEFTLIGPTVPCQLRMTNTFVTGDFDGDGRCEVASYCPATNSLNILAYFYYGDLAPQSPQWRETPPQMVNAWACLGAIPAGPGVAQAWTFDSNDTYQSAYLSGQGAFLTIFNPVSLNFGIAQWTGTGMQLVWFSTGSTAPYCGLSSSNRFFVADLNGDGNDELIQFTGDDLYLFVLQFQPGAAPGAAGTLSYISSSHLTVGPWTMSSDDIVVPAHLDAGAADQLLVIAVGGTSLCVLSFASGAFTGVLSAPPVSFQLGVGLQGADFDGDGLDEIVSTENTLPYGSETVCMWKWNGTNFSSVPVTGIANSSSAVNWLIPLRLAGGGALAVAFYPSAPLVFVSGMVDGAFTVLWQQQSSVPGNDVGLAINQCFAADVDGDGNDELLMFGASQGWLLTVKWIEAQLQDFMSVQTATQAWSISLLAAAPRTPFVVPPFAGNQLTAYQQISQKLYPLVDGDLGSHTCSADDIRSCYPWLSANDFVTLQVALNGISAPDTWQAVVTALTADFIYSYICASLDAECGNDIRSEYNNTNSADQFIFSELGEQVANMTQPQPPCWTTTDWTEMQNQLKEELFGIGSVVAWSAGMTTMNAALTANHTWALNTALTDVNGSVTPPAPDTKMASLSMDFLGALLCAGAAVPGIGGAAAVVLSFAGSLFPAVFSAYQSGPPQDPPQVPYTDFSSQIDGQFTNASTLLTAQSTTFATDSVLLPLVGGLLNTTPWSMSKEQYQNYANSTFVPTLLQYYALFIPMRFKFLYWINVNGWDVPFYCKTEWPGQVKAALNTPQNPFPYFAEPYGNGNYNIYLLCNGSLGRADMEPELTYPSKDLLNDLFFNQELGPLPTATGVLQSDFFLGNGIWSTITRQNVVPDC